MSDYQSVIDLAQKAERDGALRQALERCQSLDDVAQVAADAGVPVSADELQAFGEHVRKMQKRAAEEELSEAELETVAGGALFTTALVVAGVLGVAGTGLAIGAGGLGVAVAGMVHSARNG